MRQGHRLQFFLFAVPLPYVLGGPNATRGARSKFAQKNSVQVNQMFAGARWLQTHFQPDEWFADEAQSSLPAYLPVAPDAPKLPGFRIDEDRHRRATLTLAGMIVLGRCFLVQSFVRSHTVVVVHPAIASPLLRSDPSRSGLRQVGFELPVHLFMRAVLLRMCGRNELHPDAQGCPPSTQARKSCRASRSEAVVHPNHLRFAVARKQPEKHCSHTPPLLIGQHGDRQDKTAEQIAHGQRINAFSVGGPEPALEVHRPHVIGTGRLCQSRPIHRRSRKRTPGPPSCEAPTLQPIGDCSYGRNLSSGIFSAQVSTDLFGPPAPVAPPYRSDGLKPISSCLIGRMPGAPGLISQASSALKLKTRKPFVSGLPTDPAATTDLTKRLMGLAEQFYKTLSCLNQRNGFPGHSPEKTGYFASKL